MPPLTTDPSQVLLSLGGLLSKEVHLDEFLQMLVTRVAAEMQADRGTLYLLDPARNELFSRAAHLPELAQIRLKVGQGVAGRVAQRGELVNVPDARGEGQFFTDIDKLTGYKTSSLLAVPLRAKGGDVFGVLQVLNRRGSPRFTEEDERLLQQLASQISGALQATSLYQELQRAKEQPNAPVGYFFNRIIGESEPMKQIYRIIRKAAETEATVLIHGESGSGKELFARAVHVNSARRARPFVKVDCAALPPSLIENELFGHERGAYTGADHRVEGKFEAAGGGTVFIDELGELPLSAQGKLLRVLQDRELERIGGTQTVKIEVRIVAATNRNLMRMVEEGKFREDLYYRIKVVEVSVPPLRERGAEDVERLARHFIATAAKKHRREPPPKISPGALQQLIGYRWPGNVRELEHCMESAVVLCEGDILEEHLSLPSRQRPAPPPESVKLPSSPERFLPLAQIERQYILRVLAALDGNRTAAARTLGIGRNTLARKLKEYGVEGEGDVGPPPQGH